MARLYVHIIFSDRVSSQKLLAVSAAGPPAAFFQKLTCLDFLDMPILGKVWFCSDLIKTSNLNLEILKAKHSGMGPNFRRPAPLLIFQYLNLEILKDQAFW